jgi:DNA (cytosine-5)-methyltransferase 1
MSASETTPVSYAVLSFFTGAMGLDIGLEQAGLDLRMGQELDAQAAETIRANGHCVVEGDLRKLLGDDPELSSFMQSAGVTKGEAFAVVGGPPCQPFSTAGHRMGVDDPRGMLIFDYLRAVDAIRPRFVILENVKGILNAQGVRGKTLVEEIRDTLAHMGYTTTWGVVDAVHYGAAQFRERVIIIGSRDHEPVFIPMPTHFPRHQDPAYRWRTLSSVLRGIESSAGESAKFSPKIQEVLNLIPEGGNWRSLPPEIAEVAMGGAWKSGGGKVGFFRRLNGAEPSPTLVTSPIQKATMLAHPTEPRPLSVRDCALIQGFPDGWVFEGNLTSQYKQIGNAVPVPLGRAIGLMLKSVADNSAEVKTKRRRGTSTHSELVSHYAVKATVRR